MTFLELGGFFGGFGQRVKHGNGVDVLAGDGWAEFEHFGMFWCFYIFYRNVNDDNKLSQI